MTSANRLKGAESLPILSKEGFQRNSRPTFWLKSIFVGPNGLRAGWRVLMFIALFALLFGSFVLIRAGGLQGFREQYRNQSHITITPLVMGRSEAITLLFLSVTALFCPRSSGGASHSSWAGLVEEFLFRGYIEMVSAQLLFHFFLFYDSVKYLGLSVKESFAWNG